MLMARDGAKVAVRSLGRNVSEERFALLDAFADELLSLPA
jgi:hypothetical protein